ncbi:MAG: transcriptional regulator [Chloroflexi bacterium]|nr:transcriptional regulator [Chloroflexota bacterium]
MNPSSFSAQTESDFGKARFKAFWRDVAAMFSRRPNELVSFDQVKRSLKTLGESYRGIKTVPIAHIVGSATLRFHDFDRAFLPTSERTKSRWRSVDAAWYEEKDLPPVQLYKIGDTYFVRDGHHRVSVAREKGQEFIEAEIIEVKTRVPVTPDLIAADLEVVGEYSDFIERTRLDKIRPEQKIRFSEPGGYARLIEHIAVHRYFLGAEQAHKIPWEDAVASWYDNVYLPVVAAIHAHNILNDFPSRTEADLYLWITDHHYFLHEQDEEVDLEQAAVDFAEHYSQRFDKRLLNAMKQAVTEFLDSETLKPVIETLIPEPTTDLEEIRRVPE